MWFKILQCLDDVGKILQNESLSIDKELTHTSQSQQDIHLLRESWHSICQEVKIPL